MLFNWFVEDSLCSIDKLVLLNLSKLLHLIDVCQNCPVDVPKRIERLSQTFNDFCPLSEDVVSVAVSGKLERAIEANIDQEKDDRRAEILKELIEMFTSSSFVFPLRNSIIFLISPLTSCDMCKGALTVLRPGRAGREVNVFTRNHGTVCGVSFHKHCSSCNSNVYLNYSETEILTEGGSKISRKFNNSVSKYFSFTQDTFFETALLESITDDVFICDSRFVRIVDKYNSRLDQGDIKLNRLRLLEVWFPYMMSKHLPLMKFDVVRKRWRNIDMEQFCKQMYPLLKKTIDSKWFSHHCEKCKSRLVVMDGNMKLFRSVCSTKGEKVLNRAQLNQFTACHHSPLPGESFCKDHCDEKEAPIEERMDCGPLTRARRKELGVDVDVLSSEVGCRKTEAINVRTKRSKTAGMLYMLRPCGVSLGHLECIHAETCTDFLTLLISIFGERPSKDDLTGVVVDRACDIHPYIKRIGREGNLVCEYYSNLHWIVDPFHVRLHVEEKCKLNSPKGEYHPGLMRHKSLVENMNMEICEQSFLKLNKSKETTRYLTLYSRLVFFKLLDNFKNERIITATVSEATPLVGEHG